MSNLEEYFNTCKEDAIKTEPSELADSINNIYNEASKIGMKAVLFNKDDLPAFMEVAHFNTDNFNNMAYNSRIPIAVQCVGFALGIYNIDMTTDIYDIEWIHDPYNNIVFDENGRQIGHFVYHNDNQNEVILYREPIRPQVYEYLDDEVYDYESSSTEELNLNFTSMLNNVLNTYGIIDAKYVEDVHGNSWIYSKFNNIIFNEFGKQIGHMIFPYAISNFCQPIIYSNPVDPIPNMV
jgi:hypothetical protein